MRGKFSLNGMNGMLFAQMERLANAGPDEVEAEIERSRSMAKLANSAVASASAMLQAARMQAQAQGQLACAVTMESTVPAVLLGQSTPEPPAAASLSEADQDSVDAFLESNAAGHTVSWLADRLRSSGIAVTAADVRARCGELGLEPVRLDDAGGKWSSENMGGIAR